MVSSLGQAKTLHAHVSLTRSSLGSAYRDGSSQAAYRLRVQEAGKQKPVGICHSAHHRSQAHVWTDGQAHLAVVPAPCRQSQTLSCKARAMACHSSLDAQPALVHDVGALKGIGHLHSGLLQTGSIVADARKLALQVLSLYI